MLPKLSLNVERRYLHFTCVHQHSASSLGTDYDHAICERDWRAVDSSDLSNHAAHAMCCAHGVVQEFEGKVKLRALHVHKKLFDFTLIFCIS